MNRIRPLIIFSIISAFGFSGILISSCKRKSFEGSIVFTEVNGKIQDPGLFTRESINRDIQARIVVINGKSGSQPDVLTQGFYSARSPGISCDGNRMLFCAMQKPGDKWQIWEMDLTSLQSRRVTNISANCFDPAYLPNGRVLFTIRPLKDVPVAGSLASCNPDGTDVTQITFNPYDYSASSILNDGRVLAISSIADTASGDAVFMVLRPDGTKNELFYKGPGSGRLRSRGRETANGKILFIESDSSNEDRGDLISIEYNRPLHTRLNLSAGGDFASVFPLKSGKLLVSYRKSKSDRYGLCEFDPVKKEISRNVYTGGNDYDIIEAVAVEKHNRSKKLPSEVDMGVKTGLILCQDVNYHDINASVDNKLKGVNRIRVIGKDSTLGEIDVEKDGSFYLKVIADTPFRIQAVDDKGNTVGNPCGWIYLRPNERRGCVGCHEDHETVPDNKVSLAVKHSPSNIPGHISKVVEKKVSLE